MTMATKGKKRPAAEHVDPLDEYFRILRRGSGFRTKVVVELVVDGLSGRGLGVIKNAARFLRQAIKEDAFEDLVPMRVVTMKVRAGARVASKTAAPTTKKRRSSP